tara:strand:- start:2535 stop:2987 length:453 start_codon:yes stop_codon:yes gene_type:complete
MTLDILYATTTGNAEIVAKNLKDLAIKEGFKVSLNEMNFHNISSFRKLSQVAIITSTYGDGDVPEMGLDFWQELNDSNEEMKNLKYGLVALGDRSHENFCGAGKKISTKLEELNAKKIIDNLECDGDTEGSHEWSLSFLDKLKEFRSSAK